MILENGFHKKLLNLITKYSTDIQTEVQWAQIDMKIGSN